MNKYQISSLPAASNAKSQIPNKRFHWILDIGYWILNIPAFQAGFTLIELLIVVAIIGILATLLMANFINVRQRARDAQRKSDIRQIQSALELYRSDAGTYPPASNLNALNSTPCPTPSAYNPSGTTYMQQIPCDPLGSGAYNAGNYYYSTANNNSTYTLGACLENGADGEGVSSSSFSGANDSACSSKLYYVKNNP